MFWSSDSGLEERGAAAPSPNSTGPGSSDSPNTAAAEASSLKGQ